MVKISISDHLKNNEINNYMRYINLSLIFTFLILIVLYTAWYYKYRNCLYGRRKVCENKTCTVKGIEAKNCTATLNLVEGKEYNFEYLKDGNIANFGLCIINDNMISNCSGLSSGSTVTQGYCITENSGTSQIDIYSGKMDSFSAITAYSISSIFDNLNKSIMILKEDKFVPSDLSENFVYNYMFIEKYNKTMEKYKKSKYYGTYIYRGGEEEKYLSSKQETFFRIIDTSNEKNKGIICTKSVGVPKLKEIIKYLDKDKKFTNIYQGNEKYKKRKYCDIISDLMIKLDLMFVSV